MNLRVRRNNEMILSKVMYVLCTFIYACVCMCCIKNKDCYVQKQPKYKQHSAGIGEILQLTISQHQKVYKNSKKKKREIDREM